MLCTSSPSVTGADVTPSAGRRAQSTTPIKQNYFPLWTVAPQASSALYPAFILFVHHKSSSNARERKNKQTGKCQQLNWDRKVQLALVLLRFQKDDLSPVLMTLLSLPLLIGPSLHLGHCLMGRCQGWWVNWAARIRKGQTGMLYQRIRASECVSEGAKKERVWACVPVSPKCVRHKLSSSVSQRCTLLLLSLTSSVYSRCNPCVPVSGKQQDGVLN